MTSNNSQTPAIRQVVNDRNIPVAYACEGTAENDYAVMSAPYYYELKYPCAEESVDQPITFVASDLLNFAATHYRILPKATGCIEPPPLNPQTGKPTQLWLASVSSDPPDRAFDSLQCTRLPTEDDAANGFCCVVVQGEMTYQVIGDQADPMDMNTFIANELDRGGGFPNTQYTTSFIGSVLTAEIGDGQGGAAGEARGNLPPAINAVEKTVTQQPQGKERFTVVGGFILGGLIATFIGIFAILVYRRRRHVRSLDAMQTSSKSDLDMADGGGDSSETGGPSLDIDVLSDEQQQQRRQLSTTASSELDDAMMKSSAAATGGYSNSSYPNPYQEERGGGGGADGEGSGGGGGDNTPQSYSQADSYTFDLGNNFKDQIMGTYLGRNPPGPTSMAVVPPYPCMEETSDSEADSWAQTDGTVGSLEERLEEITAEI